MKRLLNSFTEDHLRKVCINAKQTCLPGRRRIATI
jgi:hypothetical protein